jgi:hypothetical protein
VGLEVGNTSDLTADPRSATIGGRSTGGSLLYRCKGHTTLKDVIVLKRGKLGVVLPPEIEIGCVPAFTSGTLHLYSKGSSVANSTCSVALEVPGHALVRVPRASLCIPSDGRLAHWYEGCHEEGKVPGNNEA